MHHHGGLTASRWSPRRGPEVGPDERGMPPAMLERVRGAALRCLAATAADAGARPVMLTLAWDVGEAVAPLLGNAHAAPLREAAAKVGPTRLAQNETYGVRQCSLEIDSAIAGVEMPDTAAYANRRAQALMAVAQVDSDAVWLLLTQLTTEAAPASAASLHPVPAGAPAGTFKPFRNLLLRLQRGHSALAQRGRSDGVGQRAMALLKRLEAAENPPAWSPP